MSMANRYPEAFGLTITDAPAAVPQAAGDSLSRRAESNAIREHIESWDEVSCPTCWGTGTDDYGNTCVCSKEVA